MSTEEQQVKSGQLSQYLDEIILECKRKSMNNHNSIGNAIKANRKRLLGKAQQKDGSPSKRSLVRESESQGDTGANNNSSYTNTLATKPTAHTLPYSDLYTPSHSLLKLAAIRLRNTHKYSANADVAAAVNSRSLFCRRLTSATPPHSLLKLAAIRHRNKQKYRANVNVAATADSNHLFSRRSTSATPPSYSSCSDLDLYIPAESMLHIDALRHHNRKSLHENDNVATANFYSFCCQPSTSPTPSSSSFDTGFSSTSTSSSSCNASEYLYNHDHLNNNSRNKCQQPQDNRTHHHQCF